MTRWWLYLMVVPCLVQSMGLQAHTPSESFSRWRYTGQSLTMQFTVNAREVSRIPGSVNPASLQGNLANYLADHIAIGSEGSGCEESGRPKILVTRPGYVQIEMGWHCAKPPTSLAVSAFFDLAAEHVHFASFESPQGLVQKLLTRESPDWNLAAFSGEQPLIEDAQSGFKDYVNLGFSHITRGLDHVAFLIGLLLLCRRLRDVAWAVTGFTLGHSMTLSLAALGLVQANVAAVESAIGLTIALVAIERTASTIAHALPLALGCSGLILLLVPLAESHNASIGTTGLTGLALFSFCYLMSSRELADGGSYRAIISVLFGLIHGFGFAGGFQAAGMGRNSLLIPLAGFNIGVELGQLALVAAILAIMAAVGLIMGHRNRIATVAADWIAAMVCGAGVFWFVQRSVLSGTLLQ